MIRSFNIAHQLYYTFQLVSCVRAWLQHVALRINSPVKYYIIWLHSITIKPVLRESIDKMSVRFHFTWVYSRLNDMHKMLLKCRSKHIQTNRHLIGHQLSLTKHPRIMYSTGIRILRKCQLRGVKILEYYLLEFRSLAPTLQTVQSVNLCMCILRGQYYKGDRHFCNKYVRVKHTWIDWYFITFGWMWYWGRMRSGFLHLYPLLLLLIPPHHHHPPPTPPPPHSRYTEGFYLQAGHILIGYSTKEKQWITAETSSFLIL